MQINASLVKKLDFFLYALLNCRKYMHEKLYSQQEKENVSTNAPKTYTVQHAQALLRNTDAAGID